MNNTFVKAWTNIHNAIIVLYIALIACGLVFAFIVNNVSQQQRMVVDANLQTFSNNQTTLAPLLSLLVFGALGFLLVLFKIKGIPHHTLSTMANICEHGIMWPLLYFVSFFFTDDIIKSCSVEIIVSALLMITLINGVFILGSLYWIFRRHISKI